MQERWVHMVAWGLSIKVKDLRTCRKDGYVWYTWGLSIRV